MMSDYTIPNHDEKVNIDQTINVNYWCIKLNCNLDQLRDAVEKAGTATGEVISYILSKLK
jgi:hypothetical protein